MIILISDLNPHLVDDEILSNIPDVSSELVFLAHPFTPNVGERSFHMLNLHPPTPDYK